VIFDKDLIIKKVKILAYREDWGGEITSKRWLKQFKGSDPTTSLRYGSDVMGISGATISARSMTNAVNALLLNLSKLQQ
jgi:Na+-translocating ferredoxin:NAD+ oxidoreductase RnfG subunit